ncbi:MAG: hypothetical protein R6U50_00955 [Desulfobacterales bacterium]
MPELINYIFRNIEIWLKIPHEIAAPGGMAGSSNFFQSAAAVAGTLSGQASPAVPATIVGVLVEVPVMLFLVRIASDPNAPSFPEPAPP